VGLKIPFLFLFWTEGALAEDVLAMDRPEAGLFVGRTNAPEERQE